MMWLMVLYLIGGYIRMYGVPKVKRNSMYLLGYFMFGVAQVALKIMIEFVDRKLFGAVSHGDLFLTYPSPLIVGEAICLFAFFKDALAGLKQDGFGAKLIKFVTPGVFSVYLIHVHPLVFWKVIVDGLKAWASWPLLQIIGMIFGVAAAVFAACVVLDYIRRKLFAILRIDSATEWVSNKIENTARNLFKG